MLMSRDPAEILREALRLPPEASAAIAASLIESLDEHIDENAEADWATEIVRRMAELDGGTVESIPWSEARRRLGERIVSSSPLCCTRPPSKNTIQILAIAHGRRRAGYWKSRS